MKEIRFVPNQTELTGKVNPSTLEVKGNIFMAGESTGEGSPNTSNVEPAKRAQARAEFDQENAGRRLTPSELKRQNEDIMRGVGPTERRLRLDEEQTRRLIEEAVGSGEKVMAGASDTDPEQDVSWSRPGDLGTKSFSADEENDKTASDIEDAEDLFRRSREIEEPLRESILEALEEHGISVEEVRSRAPEVVEILRGILKNNEESQSQGEVGVRTGNATWRMKEEDRPIVVTGSLGKDAEGREYVSIEGSNTGIPLDQIEYPKEPSLEEIATDVTEEESEPEGITEEAQRLLRRDPPGEIGENIKRILRENGVSEEDINSKNSEELFDILRRKNAAAAGGSGEPPKGRPTAEETPEEPEKTPPPASAGAGGKGGEPPEEPPITPPSSDEEPEEHIEIASDMVVDSEIRNIQNRGRMRVRNARNDEERYEAMAQTNLELISIADRETPEGTPSLAWQKISTILDNEKERDIYAARLAASRKEDLDVQAREKIAQIKEILTGDKTDDAKLDEIEGIISRLDPNERAYPHIIENAFKDIEGGEYDHLIEDILEYSLEMFLSRADSQPTEDYPQFTLAEGENMSIITQAARRFDKRREKAGVKLGEESGKKEMFRYLTTLTNRRRIMHELYKSMNDLESYTGLVTRALRQNGTSFVEKQLIGVSDVQIIYDQVLLTLKALKPREEGWLLESDFARGDELAKKVLEQSMRGNSEHFYKRFIIKTETKDDGTEEDVKATRALRPWEIERAFHMGRDLSAATQRRVVYGILGDVPKNPDEFLKSVAHEPIARRLAPLKLIPQRFFSQGISKRFLELFRNEQKAFIGRDGKTYGYTRKGKDGKDEYVGMFGSSQEDFAILDVGIVDPKSNSWRARLLYLKNELFKNEEINGGKVTLGEYLDKTKGEFTKGLDPHKGRKEKKEIREAKKNWNKFLRGEDAQGKIHGGRIQEQRLFLGVLMRYPDLDEKNKELIWENVANLMPSRIASLIPDEALEIVESNLGAKNRKDAGEKWTDIASKLWIAERMRVMNDARILTGQGGKDDSLHELDHYFSKVGLTPQEIAVIEDIRELGRKFAPTLAKVKFPFTAFLDDAPETGWGELSDFDFTRIMVNDQSAFQEGYGHIIGLIDNPVRKSDDVVNILHEAFEKIKGPPGVEDAQKIFEPIVKATIGMRSMNIEAKFLGTFLSRLFRMPTSEIEKYNLSARVADDELEVSAMLSGLAQIEIVNDDPNEADIDTGMTQYMRMKKELNADKKALALAYARIILQIFGPIFGAELLKALGIKLD